LSHDIRSAPYHFDAGDSVTKVAQLHKSDVLQGNGVAPSAFSEGRRSASFLTPFCRRHHLSADTKDVIKLGMGLVGTMAAGVLGRVQIVGQTRRCGVRTGGFSGGIGRLNSQGPSDSGNRAGRRHPTSQGEGHGGPLISPGLYPGSPWAAYRA
jgi:hypothetical protein